MIDVAMVDSKAIEINHEHDLFQQSMQTGLEHAIRCGELLIEAKGWTEYGEFQGWIENNCSFAYRTAAQYMKLALNVHDHALLNNAKSIGEALKLLSKPKEKSTSRPEPERELAFSWPKDPDVIAMQEGIQAVRQGVSKLTNSTVDRSMAGHLLEMTRDQLANIVKDINRHIA